MGKECYRCHEDIVHEQRKWCVCLDCLIDLLRERGLLVLPSKVIDKDFDPKHRRSSPEELWDINLDHIPFEDEECDEEF